MKLPELREGDLHLVFDDTANHAKVFRKQGGVGVLVFSCEMRNATVEDGFGHHGWCPRGIFILGPPANVHLVPFGFHFTPLFDLDPHGAMHQEGRHGIGIHGGGTGLADPFAAQQGWQVTHGCLRVQNEANGFLVALIRQAQAAGRSAYITVGGKAG